MSADQPDPSLLQAYLNGSEPAFGSLVERYLPLVHAAALRQVNDPHAAEDITQAVFILLAQKAHSLRTRPVLSGWLLQTASFCAADLRKRAQRRAFHERKVATMKSELITHEATVAELAPHLDAALAMLSPTDRDAVVLHFLENQTLQEVGQTLGLSKDAANKRVARALEKLRTRLIRQGLMLSVATLGTLLGAEVLSAAPVPTTLAAATTSTAMAAAHGTLATTTALTLAKGVMHMMFLAKAKLTLAAALALAILATITGTAVHYALAQTLPPTATVPATTSPSMQPAKELTLDLGDKAALKLMLIPAGKFLMGSPETEKGRYQAEVQHEVRISKPFYMGVTHVTVDQFAAFVQDSGYRTDAENAGWSIGIKITNGEYDHIVGCSWRNPSFDQKGDHPVVEVSWNDATAFCDWLSKKSGKAVTLPTEAQWEYARRAGTTTAYPWGDNPDDGKGWANCADQSFKKQVPGEAASDTVFTWDDGFAFTSPVGSFKPNGFGLYDMMGNAWQWCQDRYDHPKAGTTASTETGAATDPTGPATGPLRQLRGGSWWGSTNYYRSAYRSIHWEPAHRDAYIGFRVVVVAATAPSTVPTSAASAKPADPQTSIYEPIYVLRNSVVFARAEETYAAVRDLAEIGKPAVPALCAELERTSDLGDGELRTIAFTLRIIGDPRAVPALIHALSQTSIRASDCGESVLDQDVWKFVHDHPLASRKAGDGYPEIFVPRSDREIIDALETLTRHTVSNAHNYSAPTDSPANLEAAKTRRQEDVDLWEEWWSDHWKDLLTAEELASLKLPPQADDLVAAAGIARFGPLFPTGGQIKLGPVHELLLAPADMWDCKAYIDFDTGKTYALFEGARFSNTCLPWWHATGIDASERTYGVKEDKDPEKDKWIHRLGGCDLCTWAVENARWDSLEAEIRSGKPMDLGKFGPSDFNSTDPATFPATFLIATREGGCGILQILGSSDAPPGVKLRFRMFEGFPLHTVVTKGATAPALREDVSFGRETKMTLASPESKDACALNLDTGEKRAAEGVLSEPNRPHWLNTEKSHDWLVKWHGDIIVKPQEPGEPVSALRTDDATVCAVSRAAWDKLTAAELLAIVARQVPEQETFMTLESSWTNRTTWAFKTREGAVGLLQIIEGAANPQSLTFKYKLVTGAGASPSRIPRPTSQPATQPATQSARPSS